MGNCYGKNSPRTQRNELTKEAGNGLTREAAAVGLHSGSAPPREESGVNLVRAVQADVVDGVPLPLHDALVLEGLATPFNTPAAPNAFLENSTFDLSAFDQKVTHQLNKLRFVRSALVHYVPPEDWYTCAYCNNPKGDRYGYFLCSSMSLQLLDTLMENGWWRTGEVLFKPCFPVVCCPGYALRMPITEFVLKKQHRRVIRRWASFLRHGDPRWDDRHSNSVRESSHDPTVGDSNRHVPTTETESSLVQAAVASVGVEKVEKGDVTDRPRETERVSPEETAVGDVLQQAKRERRAVTPGRGADPSKPPCRKAKVIREERKQKKRQISGKDGSYTHPWKNQSPPTRTVQPSLRDLLADHREAAHGPTAGFKHKLEVKFLGCNPRHPELTRTLDKAYQLYSKFQEAVHPGKTRFKSASDFQWGFMNSPVVNPPNRLEGSYHMHYYLDNELVMISILDVLPKYFVSIYFIYDPAIRFMTPGIYTILVELDLVQQLCKQLSTAPQYYALGYYNSNPKVSYKAQFKPQEILCNETNVFVKMESALPKLAVKPYSRLASDQLPEKAGRTASIDNLLISMRLSGLDSVPYHSLDNQLKKIYRGPLRELISETGVDAAHQMIIALPVH